MKILSIHSKNFKSFEDVKHQLFDRTLIAGGNYQGKTSFAEAVMVALYGVTITGSPHTDHLIRTGAKEYEVTVDFDLNGDLYEVTRVKGKKSEVYLNGQKCTQSDIDRLLIERDRFLSIFTPGFFTDMAEREAREMLMGLIKHPSQDEVLSRMSEDEQKLLTNESLRDPDGLAKEKRAEIKTCETEINRIEGKLEAIRQRVVREIPEIRKFDESALTDLREALRARDNGDNEGHAIKAERVALERESANWRSEYERLKRQLRNVPSAPLTLGDPCPTCGEPMSEEMLNAALSSFKRQVADIEYANAETASAMKEHIARGEQIKARLAEIGEAPAPTDDSYRKTLEDEINRLELERADVLAHNATVNRMRMDAVEGASEITEAEKDIKARKDDQVTLDYQIRAIGNYRAELAKMQVEQLSKHLKRVSLQLFDVVKSTGEIKPAFHVMYDGKPFKSLSYSERIRCNLEFSTMFNRVLGADVPVFIDNSESITHFDEPEATQIFLARVVDGMPLTVTLGSKQTEGVVA